MTGNETGIANSTGCATITSKTKKRHINIPVFIPHPAAHVCAFFVISAQYPGRQYFDEQSVPGIIEAALATAGDAQCEIAFFGGSFTGIDRSLMIRLLEVGL